jgi:ribosomal protein L25 (general stress protein Ctc)
MSTQATIVKAQTRPADLAKGQIRSLRKQGLVPGVLYGKSTQVTPIQIDVKALPKGHSHAQVITLELDGKTHPVLMREVQVHPLEDNVLHIDFQAVTPDELVSVRIPPLRERAGDAKRLAERFLAELAPAGSPSATLPPALARELQRRAFPGNVRELKNLVQRLVAEASGGPIAASLPKEQPLGSVGSGAPSSFELATIEQWAIARALDAAGGNKAEAARLLGIARRTLYSKLAERDPDAS